MFEKIFGKKKSIQRTLSRDFIIALVAVILFTIIVFYIIVNNAISSKLIEIHVEGIENIEEIQSIIRRGLVLGIVNVMIIGAVLMRLSSTKMLKPIKKLTEATKKVASGDFHVELETKREDEIGELTHNFNQMVKDLGKIECLQKEFIDTISHEIKTPISSIEGFAELLKDENLSKEEKEEYIKIIKEESDRLLHLSSNILKLSKLQNQTYIVHKEEFSVAEQIRKIISTLEPKWRQKNLKVQVELIETNFVGDEELIYQVWMNLIDNAIKFSKESGKIEVKMQEEENKIRVEIKDEGEGMEEKEIQKIFQKFYQVDHSRSEEGSGLGLAIVKRIIELSKGEIKVESKKGKGSKFVIELPLEKETEKIVI